jgi:hypothetical protein
MLLVSAPALAEEDRPMDQRWPALPPDREPSLEDKITDHLTDASNKLAGQLDELSHDMFRLHVDGRSNRARLRLGTTDGHYLTFNLDSDWLFGDGKARVNAKLELGLGTHVMKVQLPAMDLIPDSYQGCRMVHVNVPLLERRF